MANEATLLVQKTFPVNMTCANGTGIEKGAILKLSDPNTAALSDGDDDVVAGICMSEKIASDGKTKVAVCAGPGDVFRVNLSGACTVGDALGTYASTGNSNTVHQLATDTSGMVRLGYALETGAANETIRMRLDVGGLA